MVGIGIGTVQDKKSLKLKGKGAVSSPLTLSTVEEARSFLERLRHLSSNKKIKMLTDKELRIEKLVEGLTAWKNHPRVEVDGCDLMDLYEVLTNIFAELKKKRISLEDSTFELLKYSFEICSGFCMVVGTEKEECEEKKESDDYCGIKNRGEISFEKICEKLYYHHCEQQRLLELIGRMKRF